MEDYIYIGLIVLAVVFLFFLWVGNSKQERSTDESMPLKMKGDASLPLRMQAYERLALFLERSKPQSLVMRLMGSTKAAKELEIVLLNTIREEFEHNFSQQIYVSETLWQHITLTKDKLVQLVNKAAVAQSESTVKALAEELLLQYTNDDDFIGKTLKMLREEARSLQK